MKYILGVSAGYHDAAAAVVRSDGEIMFAGHSERYSKKKNDKLLHTDLLQDAGQWDWSTVAYYERPWMHNIQQWRSGQHSYGPWRLRTALKQHMGHWYPESAGVTCASHHLSHAAAGFQTSPFETAAVVVIDAIGELDTISIYRAGYSAADGCAQYQLLWRQGYPHSIGLFYSAITKAVDLKPMEEEYITMGMAAYGSDLGAAWMRDHFIDDIKTARFKKNLHIGLDPYELPFLRKEDIAAAAQTLTESLVQNIMQHARALTGESNLVYMGGVALNCVANSSLGNVFDHIWIMPNPGDAGSSLGAAALAFGRRLNWKTAFLGHMIPGAYPVRAVIDELLANKIVGVASGRAEFGPRALGNRSLLADPRGPDIKDRVNLIKRRQQFRPFAPVVLAEFASTHFDMPHNWESSHYMQIVAPCRHPAQFPAICHVDNTARVQTVPADGSGIRQLLEDWHMLTGCPMLLNTSLNIRGKPVVNDRADADRFEQQYGVKVCS
jgi:carbamoyltransferase